MIRAVIIVLIEQLFSQTFLLFFQEQGKQEKQETFPKFGNLTEGKIFDTLRIPASHSNICGKEKKNMEIQKMRKKKKGEI